jgi:hypothetical protein
MSGNSVMIGRRPRLGGVFVLTVVPDLGGLSNLREKLVARLILNLSG